MRNTIKFTEFQRIISKYYPFGINCSDPEFEKHQSWIKLKNLVSYHLNNAEKRSHWDILINTLKIAFPELTEVRDAGKPFDVCYSVVLVINREKVGKFIYEQHLYCRLSFLADYFCIYGLDYIEVNDNNNRTFFEPSLTISPIGNYEEYFKKTKEIVEKIFPAHQFLSFFYFRVRVDDLMISLKLGIGSRFSSIFQALFTSQNITDYLTHGDMSYCQFAYENTDEA
jgi:hypothetical protein